MPNSLQSIVKALYGIAWLNVLADGIIMFAGGNARD